MCCCVAGWRQPSRVPSGYEQEHLKWLVFVCGYKLFQTFWFELWITDYFILVLHNPPIEIKKKEQKFPFKSVVLTEDCTIVSASSAFSGNLSSVFQLVSLAIINVSNRFDSQKCWARVFWLVAGNGLLFADFYPDILLPRLSFLVILVSGHISP